MVGEDQELEDRIRAYGEVLPDGKAITPEQARTRAVELWARHRRRRRAMLAAAAMVLLLATGLFVRASLAGTVDASVTAERPTPRDLWELADRVAAHPPTSVFGETYDARYTYRRVTRTTDQPGSEVTSDIEEMWVAIDGSGRQVTAPEDNPTQTSEGSARPDLFTVDGVPVSVFHALPDDIDAFVDAFATYGMHGFTNEASPAFVDALGYTGLPGPARAGALRALDELGMRPVPDANPGPHLLRVEGPRGPDGWRLQADFDLRTGMAVAWELLGHDGDVARVVTVEVDLRRDMRSRP